MLYYLNNLKIVQDAFNFSDEELKKIQEKESVLLAKIPPEELEVLIGFLKSNEITINKAHNLVILNYKLEELEAKYKLIQEVFHEEGLFKENPKLFTKEKLSLHNIIKKCSLNYIPYKDENGRPLPFLLYKSEKEALDEIQEIIDKRESENSILKSPDISSFNNLNHVSEEPISNPVSEEIKFESVPDEEDAIELATLEDVNLDALEQPKEEKNESVFDLSGIQPLDEISDNETVEPINTDYSFDSDMSNLEARTNSFADIVNETREYQSAMNSETDFQADFEKNLADSVGDIDIMSIEPDSFNIGGRRAV